MAKKEKTLPEAQAELLATRATFPDVVVGIDVASPTGAADPHSADVEPETAPEKALREHGSKSVSALKADIIAKHAELSAFAIVRADLAALKYVLALRIGSAQIEIDGAVLRAKRPSGKGERVYPLTLVSQTQLATYDGD